ncbi:Peptide synthetase [Pyrenophora teres f. maculata]|nr:Peptide synthetase [Pyrenophora teres f. maculata]
MSDVTIFGLSPFQKWLLHASRLGGKPFQYCRLHLHICRPVTYEELSDGLRMLADAHPMLRARFNFSNNVGATQYIVEEAENFLSLQIHDITGPDADTSAHIRYAQQGSDITTGPSFGVDLFRIHTASGTMNVLTLKAHPLIIDLLSWDIIKQDLDSWFRNATKPIKELVSFPRWLTVLATQSKLIGEQPPPVLLPAGACSSMASEFWGINNAAHSLHEVRNYSFILQHTKCGVSMIDELLGALLFTFSEVFGHEHVPNAFLREHGREFLDFDVDLSHTVGCFGDFSPITIQPGCSTIIDAISQVHQKRTAADTKRLSCFAARLTDPANAVKLLEQHFPMEIMFTYHGLSKPVAMAESLFEPHEPAETLNCDMYIPPSSLINVCISDEGSNFKVVVEYNRKLRRQQHLFKWFGRFKSTCTSLVNPASTASCNPGKAIPSIRASQAIAPRNPFFESIYLGLRNAGLDLAGNELDDAYPCPPVQQGMLVSMLNQRASIYDAHLLFRFNSAPGENMASSSQLAAAWNKIVRRHTMLRTVFAEFLGEKTSSPFCMGVLRSINTLDILQFKTCADGNQVVLDYKSEMNKPSKDGLSSKPLACLTIYQVSSSPRTLYCYLRKNHLMMDAISSMNIITELLQGYVGKLDDDVVSYVEKRSALGIQYLEELFQFEILKKLLDQVINMNILRIRVASHEKTALELVQTCQSDLHKAMPFQAASLPRIYRNLGIREHQPFNTIVDVQRTDVRRTTFDIGLGPQIDILDMKEMDEYDLALAVCDGPETLSVRLNYSTSHISESQAAQVMAAFGAAVRSLVSNPSVLVGRLSLMDSDQRTQIAKWNLTNPVQSSSTLDELVRRNSSKRPLAPALKSTAFDISYGELDDYSHQLAQWLVSKGVGPGQVVTLCFEKSVWGVVAMCGVHRAGAAFSHLDPDWPQQRWCDIVARTESVVGLASPSMQNKVSTLLEHVLEVDTDMFALLRASDDSEVEIPKQNPQNLAYVISTSGSTGKPKVVAISQLAISSALSAQIVAYKINEDSRVAQFASYVFDSCILEIFGTLVAGGCVCVPTQEERMSDFAGFVRRMNINLLDVTPSLMRTLSPRDVPSVKILSLGGEALNQSDVNTWASHTYLINTYGPSEASVNAAISHQLFPDSDASNIGFAVGCRLWIVDPVNENLLAPIGAVGELLIDGPILANGYLRDDAATSSAFVSNLDWQKDELFRGLVDRCNTVRKFYKTGDLVRYNSDGSLNFLGRRDAQIKIRGYRIERQEVEHHIRSIPGLEHVAVFDGKEGFCKGKLIAVVSVCHEANGADERGDGDASNSLWQLYEPSKIAETAHLEQQIRRQLASPLPKYMIPDVLLITRRLPLLVSYKVDLKTIERAVYDMDQDTFRRANEPHWVNEINPEVDGTDLEKRVRQIWAKVLDVNEADINLDSSFFSLGGDSITAMKVTRRCRESGLEMTTQDLLTSRTVRGLAARITDKSGKVHSPTECKKAQPDICPDMVALLPVTTDQVEAVVPATPYQSQVYEASHMHAGRPYFVSYLAHVTEKGSRHNVDVKRFSQAWQSVVDRHPIMRTLFIKNPSDGTLYQVVLRGIHTRITTHDVEGDDDPTEHLLAEHLAFTQKCTSGTTGMKLQPPHEVAMYRSCSGSVLLRLSLSHLLTDSVALEHMFADIDAFYNKYVPDQPSVAFANYAGWFETDVVAANNKAWQDSILHRVQACFLLGTERKSQDDLAQPILQTSLPFSLPPSQRLAISEFCKAAQVTISSFFSFCWALLLKELTQQHRVCFGQLISGRDAPIDGIHEVVGPVLSVLPTLVDFSCSSSASMELIQRFQKANNEAAAYQPCSLNNIEKSMGCLAYRGLFNTVVNIRKVHYHEQELETQLQSRSLQFKLVKSYDTSEYDFVLQIDDNERGISGALKFWSSQFEVERVQAIVDTYLRILDRVSNSAEV